MSSSQRRVALYGGAFDPFHNGHLATIDLLLRSKRVDAVIVIPSGDRPDKMDTSRAADRLRMTRLGVHAHCADDPRVSVSDAQVAGRAGYATIDLLRYFKKELPGDELFVVIGEELVHDLPEWREPEQLKHNATFLVVRRPGAAVVAASPVLPSEWRLLELTDPYAGEVNVSSTELRERLRTGAPCDAFMPQVVIEYCQKTHLYL